MPSECYELYVLERKFEELTAFLNRYGKEVELLLNEVEE